MSDNRINKRARCPRSLLKAVKPLCVIAAALLTTVQSFGAVSNWSPYPPGTTPGGPWGGSIRRLVAVNPSVGGILYTATAGGVFRSNNYGATWSARNQGLYSRDVTDIAVCGGNSAVLLAATRTAGVHFSQNSGSSWAPLAIDSRYMRFGAVAIDPGDCDHLFASSSDPSPQLDSPNQVFESFDAGVTWDVLEKSHARRMLFTDDGSRLLIFGTNSGYVKKYDAAASAANQSSGNAQVIGGNLGDRVQDIALVGVAGTRDGTQIAAAAHLKGVKVWRSATSTWQQVFPVPPYATAAAVAIAADPVAGGRFIFFSFDTAPGAPKTGLYQSIDYGVTPISDISTWVPLPDTGAYANALAVTAASDFLLANRSGVWSGTRGVGDFVHTSVGISAVTVNDFDFAPTGSNSTAGDHAMAVSGGAFTESGNSGLYYWNPAGAGAWTRKPTLNAQPGSTRLIEYETDTELWMSVQGFTFYYSLDGGDTWALPAGFGDAAVATNDILRIAHGAPGNMVMGAGQRPYHSEDGGVNWTHHSELEPSTWLPAKDISDPDGFFVASTEYGIYRSQDKGVSWVRTDNQFGVLANQITMSSFAASSTTPGNLYVGTPHWGLYRSVDYGVTWTPVIDSNNSLPLSANISEVAVAGLPGDQLMAAYSVYDGVYLSGDGGKSWIRHTDGLELPTGQLYGDVKTLEFTPDNRSLLIGLAGSGLHHVKVGDPPTLANAGVAQVQAGQLLTLNLVGVDNDGDSLTYSLGVPLAGASVTGSTFTWQTSAALRGLHQVPIDISDGFFKSRRIVQVNVRNNPPAFNTVDQQLVDVGNQLSFSVTATDQDGDAVTISPVGQPAGLSYDNATKLCTWTPGLQQRGLHLIEFSADDGMDQATAFVQVRVNSAPVIQPVGSDTNGDQIFELTAISGVDLNITLDAVNLDLNDPLTYSVDGQPLPSNVYTFRHDLQGPTPEVLQKVFTVTDSYGASSSITVDITTVVPAGNLPPSFNSVTDKFISVGVGTTFKVTASDPEGDAFTVDVIASSLPDGASFDQATATFSWTPTAGAPDTVVTFQATDIFGAASTMNVNLFVNEAPAITMSGSVLGQVGVAQQIVILATDPDGDQLSFDASSLPAGASIVDPNSGTISWTPASLNVRTKTATITVTDPHGLSDSCELVFVINSDPVIADAGEQVIGVGGLLSLQLPVTDAEDDVLTKTISGAPADAFYDPATDTFLWRPSAPTGAPIVVTLTATDDFGGMSTMTFTISAIAMPDTGGGGGGGGGGCFIESIGIGR